ncbi:outer membrane beta-barrel protein [Helicobacter anatolicus]|uniref:outer membrane beta-barrel protein n=1 Tax=Helicobacter anatolicus TaxID=2905874 RepID=UPI001E3F6326|nr:outer membrane beta-barrel protein [Helicobacter anatolicus]MCE3038041.1 outer membrane beta-barrel protein [Helicobacter anatolicus]
MQFKKIIPLLFFMQALFAKDGFFVGAEMQLGNTNIKEKVCGERCANGQPSINEYIYTDSKSTSFDAGLLLGYQHLFDEKKAHGLKASLHLYGGTGYKISSKAHDFYSFELNYIPIKTGLDLAYIFNFYNQEEHKVGFSVGVGYEVDVYLPSNGKYSHYPILGPANLKTKNLIAHGIYPTLGFYYILKQHHKFEINYRYTGLIKQINPDDSIIVNSQVDKDKLDPITHKLQYNNYFVLNYSYIF